MVNETCELHNYVQKSHSTLWVIIHVGSFSPVMWCNNTSYCHPGVWSAKLGVSLPWEVDSTELLQTRACSGISNGVEIFCIFLFIYFLLYLKLVLECLFVLSSYFCKYWLEINYCSELCDSRGGGRPPSVCMTARASDCCKKFFLTDTILCSKLSLYKLMRPDISQSACSSTHTRQWQFVKS